MKVETFSDLLLWIRQDRSRYSFSRFKYYKGLLFHTESSHAIRLLKWLRITEFFSNKIQSNLFLKPFYWFSYYYYCRLQFRYDTYIGLNCCGPGLWMPHIGGIVINCNLMGRNCSVTKGVVIGNRRGQENRATIGDNCYFTLGCKVIGKISIGNNVIVAQNAVVTKNCNSNVILGGIPAKVIKEFSSIDDIKI